jgi:hypothetical protein
LNCGGGKLAYTRPASRLLEEIVIKALYPASFFILASITAAESKIVQRESDSGFER